jgi:DNA invertase Pin-like site-specific DNA recombinase
MTDSTVGPAVSVLRAVSYVRVSTVGQTRRGDGPDGLSIPAQKEVCRRRAIELGVLVVVEFTEKGRSGRTMERPELARMMEYLVTHPVDFVIVHKVDRLARNAADDAVLTNRIIASGARLVSTTEAISTTASGRLLHGIMASVAEFYSNNLAGEVMKGMRQKTLHGGTPYRAPLGYLNKRVFDGDRDYRFVIPDPERAADVTWAFQVYSTGQWSLTGLAAELARRGVTTRAGSTQSAHPLSAQGLQKILRNPYYTGVVTLHCVEHPGSHEPLVDRATWQRVQEQLAERRVGERYRVHDHYLKGMVRCSGCGRALIWQHTINRHGHEYDYYVCHRRAVCSQRRALTVGYVERQVEACHQAVTLTANQVETIRRAVVALTLSDKDETVGRLAETDARIATVEVGMAKLLDAYYADVLPRDVFLAQQRRLKTERGFLIRERATLTSRPDGQQTIKAIELLSHVGDVYAQADPEQRRELNRMLFAAIYIGPDPADTRWELTEPYLTIATLRHPSGTG